MATFVVITTLLLAIIIEGVVIAFLLKRLEKELIERVDLQDKFIQERCKLHDVQKEVQVANYTIEDNEERNTGNKEIITHLKEEIDELGKK